MKQFKQLREGLWANIHKKRKEGRPMRKKGEKGAPTAAAMAKAKAGSKNGSTSMEAVEQALTQLEKAYDAKDIAKVKVLEKKLEKMLKEVDKTMKGSGLSAPAFSMVRGGIVKGLEAIKKFYRIADKNESVNEDGMMSVRKQNMSKVKPMLSKLAQKHKGVTLDFEKDGITVNFKGKDKDIDNLMRDMEKDKKLMKLMELTEGKGTDAALQKKADASGISKSILKKVYDRGLAAWKVGHKPGTTPQQWGMARVNSFITKGKVWHKYDSDLRKQHQGK